ncbi:hypothetical protein ACPOL_1126 [Acidisarcina polymorpha]|uniref:YetF C-terminal domain-containing protein n=1 Tax=Acidisarcina polymorpha TaxID=2211140 RepID=A0A2Z5FVF0_9BACT|nr:YetF domain-containing protein [Acidisarcina polymorpha]AXC10474.1 hypothetical protein ACPOL_1126 [Acidisarcina polymorpha]
MLDHMFHLPLPLLEKVARPIIVYLALIVLLRVFGKRELAQLNPFDLVVLLSLSNTVQNALIGDDNSVSGGIVGALTLLTINWLVVRLLYSSPKLERLIEGTDQTLILNGIIDHEALRKEVLSEEELLAVIHRQGFDDFDEVQECSIGPNGSFYVRGRKPSQEDERYAVLLDRLDGLGRELRDLKARLPA